MHVEETRRADDEEEEEEEEGDEDESPPPSPVPSPLPSVPSPPSSPLPPPPNLQQPPGSVTHIYEPAGQAGPGGPPKVVSFSCGAGGGSVSGGSARCGGCGSGGLYVLGSKGVSAVLPPQMQAMPSHSARARPA